MSRAGGGRAERWPSECCETPGHGAFCRINLEMWLSRAAGARERGWLVLQCSISRKYLARSW